MSEDLLTGGEPVARWSFCYDYPEADGGGFVTGEFLLRADGVMLRRMSQSLTRADTTTWQYGDWATVPGWPGETDPDRAARLLREWGYDLAPPGPARPDEQTATTPAS